MFFAGCSNEFAIEEYNDAAKLADSGDRYAKSMASGHTTTDELSYTANSFDGRETLWHGYVSESCTAELTVSLNLSEGQAKLILVDADDNITVLTERSADSDEDAELTTKVALSEGELRFRIAGHGCKELELEIFFNGLTENRKR